MLYERPTVIDALKAGDRAACEEFVRGYTPRLYRFLRRMAAAGDVEDMIQEVFLRVFRSLDRYRDDDRMDAWLFRIARNVVLDRWRERKRPEVLTEVAARGRDPGEDEEGRLIRAAIMDLPEEQRIVFLLREEGGLSFREIAETCEIPLNTALGRMHYAILRLRKTLGPILTEESIPRK